MFVYSSPEEEWLIICNNYGLDPSIAVIEDIGDDCNAYREISLAKGCHLKFSQFEIREAQRLEDIERMNRVTIQQSYTDDHNHERTKMWNNENSIRIIREEDDKTKIWNNLQKRVIKRSHQKSCNKKKREIHDSTSIVKSNKQESIDSTSSEVVAKFVHSRESIVKEIEDEHSLKHLNHDEVEDSNTVIMNEADIKAISEPTSDALLSHESVTVSKKKRKFTILHDDDSDNDDDCLHHPVTHNSCDYNTDHLITSSTIDSLNERDTKSLKSLSTNSFIPPKRSIDKLLSSLEDHSDDDAKKNIPVITKLGSSQQDAIEIFSSDDEIDTPKFFSRINQNKKSLSSLASGSLLQQKSPLVLKSEITSSPSSTNLKIHRSTEEVISEQYPESHPNGILSYYL